MKRGFRNVLLVPVVLGLCLRIWCFAVRPPSLWQDEAYWAVKAVKYAAIDAQIRPLGFMVVTQLLLKVFGAAGWVYRLMPFLASLVSIVLSAYVATRLFKRQWSQLLAVALLAISPVALEMAVEFKHYGTEVGAYVATLAALLYYLEKGTWRSLALALGTAWLSFFFSITIIFFYPALFCVLAWRAYRSKNARVFVMVAATSVVCLGTITTIYFTTWRTIKAGKAEKKWGTWYDVFYIKNGLKTTHDSRLTWSTAKYFELASVPGVDRQLWKTERIAPEKLERLKLGDLLLWSALHLAGLAFLVRRRRFEELALLWSPLLFLTAFNLAGRWPAGAFRTNTFFVPFAIFISCFAAEWLHEDSLQRRRLAFGLAGALWLSAVVFRPSVTAKGLWTKPGDVTEALALLPLNPPKDSRLLIMDFETCRPWDYYTGVDKPFEERGAKLRRTYKKTCLRTGDKLKAEMIRQARMHTRGLTILMTDPRKFTFMEDLAQRYCRSTKTTYVHDRLHLLISCLGKEAPKRGADSAVEHHDENVAGDVPLAHDRAGVGGDPTP